MLEYLVDLDYWRASCYMVPDTDGMCIVRKNGQLERWDRDSGYWANEEQPVRCIGVRVSDVPFQLRLLGRDGREYLLVAELLELIPEQQSLSNLIPLYKSQYS